MKNITPELAKLYAKDRSNHEAYKKTVDIMNRLRGHTLGEKEILNKLISERRPSEFPETQVYREKIAINYTKGTVNRVITALMKIRKSADYRIKYEADSQSKKVKQPEESLTTYCELKYPKHTSITNWLFNYCLRIMMFDPNAICLVAPNEYAPDDATLIKPTAKIFTSDMVLDYVEGEFCVIKSNEKCKYMSGNSTRTDGTIILIITPTQYFKFSQRNANGDFEQTLIFNHNIGELPAFRLKGVLLDDLEKSLVYESLIDAMHPMLDEAYREYSDLQASVVLNMHPTPWSWQAQECKTCSGSGKVKKGEKTFKCSDCGGAGRPISSPYDRIILSPASLNQKDAPTPPGGFIEKDTNIVEIQDKRIEKHLFDALAAVNMQNLAEVQLNQSGTAKEVDRDEQMVFTNAVAELLVWIADQVYYFTNEWRYMIAIPDKAERMEQLPTIAVPERFDLLNSDYLIDEIERAKKGGLNNVLTAALEMEYASKEFTMDDDVSKQLKCVFMLDPLPGLTIDEKSSLLMNKGITQKDFVISSYIQDFVKRAFIENEDFNNLPYEQQKTVIEAYADIKIKENSAQAKVMELLQPPAPPKKATA